MAFIPCMGNGGSQYTETSLWTNPSPSSNFAAQTVTLSQSVDNFKYIGIKYKYGTSTSDSDYVMAIYPVNDLKQSTEATSNARDGVTLGIHTATNQTWARTVYYVSTTSIKFTDCYRLYNQNSTQNGANPLEILGINELAQGTMVMDSGTFTGTNGSTATVTCGFQPSKVFVYAYVSDTNILSDVYDSSVNQKQICGWRTSSSSYGCSPYAMSSGTSGTIQSITSTGFTFKVGTVTTLYYVAIGSTTE